MEAVASGPTPIASAKESRACSQWVHELTSIASGSQSALAALYNGTSSRVYGHAMRLTRNSADAGEVTIDVYMQVWQQAARYDREKAGVVTWLLAICHNRAIDKLRSRARVDSHFDPHAFADQDGVDTVGPEVLALQTERAREMRRALNQLMPMQRQVLALAYYRGLTHKEIAHHSGLPLGTVKSHVRRALQSLRALREAAPGLSHPLY